VTLASLAARYGVARSYRTDRGDLVPVGRDTVVAVLAALGVDTTGRGWIGRAIAARDAELAARLVEPVSVAWDGRLAVPPADRAEVVLEDGGVVPADDAGLDNLPAGYHELRVRRAGREATGLVISTPVRAWRPRGRRARHFGVYAPLFALHRADRAGPGDLGDLARLVDWVAAQGGDTVLTLPLLAAFLDDPQEVSPYSPVSRLMWNELYAAVDREPQPPGELLDYRGAAAAQRRAIEAIVRDADHDPLTGAEVLRFLAARPEVTDYARFRAAQARHGRNWRAWPERMRAGTIDAADVDPREVRYHVIAQWLVDRQLGELGAAARRDGRLLGLDLALGTHPDGYDVWRNQRAFAATANVGAPPDSFFVAGQDWGFPPLLPDASRATGHDYVRRSIAHHLRHATLLRVDHVMGLRRMYWVPHGFAPTEGTYVDNAGPELFAIVTLESHRSRALVIGEDLGTVPPSVRAAMRRHQLVGSWVAQGALDDVARRGDFDRPGRRTVASLNTHDMPTFAGYLAGRDVDDRLDLGQVDAEAAAAQHTERRAVVDGTRRLLAPDASDAQLRDRLVADMGATDAEIVLVNLEDLWLEPRPHNVPGTSTERPNWRRPAAHGVDELDAVPGAARTLAVLRDARDGAASPAAPS
jgi:4-alpha-glucanotransferase